MQRSESAKVRSVWAAMVQRCHNPMSKDFKHYGGRGILVCDRWRAPKMGFVNFIRDLGFRPTPQHQLDRIDNDSGYQPGNVRWVTKSEQMNNRRDTVFTEIRGKKESVASAARALSVSPQVIHERVKRGIAGPITKAEAQRSIQAVISSSCTPREKERIRRIAKKLGMTPSRLLRVAALEYIDRNAP